MWKKTLLLIKILFFDKCIYLHNVFWSFYSLISLIPLVLWNHALFCMSFPAICMSLKKNYWNVVCFSLSLCLSVSLETERERDTERGLVRVVWMNTGGGYLLKHEQPTSSFTTEDNDSPSLTANSSSGRGGASWPSRLQNIFDVEHALCWSQLALGL